MVGGSEGRGPEQEPARGDSVSEPMVLMIGVIPRIPRIGDFPVVRVERLVEALSFLDHNPAVAIVVDLDLPDSCGISTLQRLTDPGRQSPVIVLVGDEPEDHEIGVNAVAAGASAYLPRQAVQPTVLESVVESLMITSAGIADLQRREARLRTAVDGTGDGLWEWKFGTGEVYFSPRCNAILGYAAEETIEVPTRWLDRVHPEDLKNVHARLDAHIEGSRGVFECEHRLANGFGDPHWILARGRAVRDPEGRVTGMAGFMMDITDRKRQEEQAIHRSLHDHLTGLANRGLFIDRVERALSIPGRDGGGHLSVMFIDLDHFKKVNDLYGHRSGDQVLIEVAGRLERVLRPGDTVARLGGDEFGILLANVQGGDLAVHVAERVLDLVSRPIAIGRNELVVNASIGIALSENGYTDAASIIDDADLAMYRAKNLGRSRFEVCNPAMHQREIARVNLESDLGQALDRQEFVVHYQPIVNLESGRVAGVEALVRWEHPDQGVLTPSQFIEVAEESGLIVPLGWWVIESACRMLGAWRRDIPEAEEMFLGVNVSPKLLMDEGMQSRLEEILDGAGLPPSALVLELPELVIHDDGDQIRGCLENMQLLGVRLAIDDFGLQHGSIAKLDWKIFDMLKLDPTITNRVNLVGEGDRLPPSLIGVAAQLGIRVIAEGVETGEQLEALCGIGCQMAQGFWFASATKAKNVEETIVAPPAWWINPRGVWKSWQ